MAVGIPFKGNGEVHIYVRPSDSTNFVLDQIVSAPTNVADVYDASTPTTSMNFGESVALSPDGKFLVIGSPHASNIYSFYRGEFQQGVPYTKSQIVKYGPNLYKAVQNIDPENKNPITAVNFGKGLPRALACPGVSVASVGALESYGLFTGVSGSKNRDVLLDTVDRIYQPMNLDGIPSLRLLETGRGALDGADLLSDAPKVYNSNVEYCLLYTSPSPRDLSTSRMPSSA